MLRQDLLTYRVGEVKLERSHVTDSVYFNSLTFGLTGRCQHANTRGKLCCHLEEGAVMLKMKGGEGRGYEEETETLKDPR